MNCVSTDPNFSSQINDRNFGFQYIVVGDLQKISTIKKSVVDPSTENDKIHSKYVVQIV